MHKKKICFIINPISGVGKQKTIEKLIEGCLDHASFDFSVAYTAAPKHATLLAKKAANEGVEIVVAVGGDGSVNEVAKGLIASNTVMGILPAGSGNGLARHLKIPMNLKKALLLLQTGNSSKIDTIQLNEELFVNIAGVGFDAHIGWEFSKFGKRGLSSYLKVILRELPALKTQKFELHYQGKSVGYQAYLISFANGSQWGNNAFIAPLADVTDGMMEIVILKKFPLLKTITLLYHLFNRKIHTTAAVEIIKTNELILKQTGNIAHIDGDPIITGQTLVIKVKPLSLNVIAFS